MKKTCLLYLTVILFVLTGCSDVVDQDQVGCVPEMRVRLSDGQPVGQTFVARHSGLNGVEVWLEPAENGAGDAIRLYLKSAPQTSDNLAIATLPVAQITGPGFYRFSFPARVDSHGTYFYIFFEVVGDEQFNLCAASGDAYLDGALYQQHQPLDAQMTFRLTYAPGLIVRELLRAGIDGIGLLAVTGLLFVLPGWALLVWLWPKPLAWGELLGLAPGLSVVLYILLLLWTDLVGLHLGVLYAWLPVLGGLIALGWRYRHLRSKHVWGKFCRWAKSDTVWPDAFFLLVLGLVFGVRLLVIRTLNAPMWGDSYQHTMMTQLLVDNGGLFNSWLPYVPYQGVTIHFGFPLTSALLSWFTQIGSAAATLLTGQIMNGLAILTLYPLMLRITEGNRWAGVGAVLVAGLFSPLPAEYVNWGRYAQLVGQVILPVAIWLSCEAIQPRANWKMLLFAGVTLTGMALSYYRMPFYYAVFVAAWLVCWGIPLMKTDGKLWGNVVGRLVGIAGIAGIIFAPWIVHVAGGRLAGSLGTGMTRTYSVRDIWNSYQEWRTLELYMPKFLQIMTLIAWLWSLVRRRWSVASLGLWILGLTSLYATRLLHLPGANLMEHFAIMIALYMPVGLLGGWLIGELMALGQQGGKTLGLSVLSGLLLVSALYFTWQQVKIVKPSYVMVTYPDTRAMTWIQDNVPRDALFLVEGFSIYNGRSAVGADAGWWIPLLAGRANTMPPQYALMNESPLEPGYKQQVVTLVVDLETVSPNSPAGLDILCSWGITHIYIGQGQGKVGAGVRQLFAPNDFENSPYFTRIYQQDRIFIYAFNSQLCVTHP